jgi:purine-binding chemotaxis protein CheW
MKSSRETDYAKPDTAIASYLDDLLQTAVSKAREPEIEETAPAKAEPEKPVPAARPAPAATVRREAPQGRRAVPQARGEKSALTRARPPEMQTLPVAEPEQAPAEVSREQPGAQEDATAPPLRPDWSERPFECLLFRVAGLQLAVPLVLLGAIHRINGPVKPIPGRPRWYMGMLPDNNQNLRIVDTGEWIMAGKVPPDTRENYRFVIRLDNSEWALACDDVAQSFTLDPDEVRWRTGRSKRPWLAGTVIKHMCALIDVGTMSAMLVRAEREKRLALD